MTTRVGTLLVVLAYSAAVSGFPGDANAQVGAAIGIIGGSALLHKAGDEFRQSIDHARAAASSILVQANDLAKQRLDQIDEIANRTIDDMVGKSEAAATRILEDATKKVNDLEDKIVADVGRVMWKAECAGKRFVTTDLGTAIGGLGKVLGTNEIQLEPPVRVLKTPAWYTGCLWRCDPYLVTVNDEFGETYKTVKRLMEGAIADDQVTDDTPADNIVRTYEYLSTFAKRASCFYEGTEERYNRDSIDYQYKAHQWNNVVNVRL
ncbi:hypothetical protein [Mesorhizobium sp.]|uniref:hypothetical protein n=1 Tax=Mesorhizobium sp. TaxID=1871066 RepID=UPI000FE8D93B|nr:hypothetical protein [Mesorhizobium sp.]RWB65418.1 MAG: hypothetical protein EOQ49_32180 [Mesorhizobium sp.]